MGREKPRVGTRNLFRSNALRFPGNRAYLHI